MPLQVYVPVHPDRLSLILKGSAIVSDGQLRDGQLLVYFEGNLYGAVNLQRFEDKMLQAAGRLVQKYPTVARCLMPVDQLMEVGTYDYPNQRFQAKPDTLSALNQWLEMT